MTQFERNILKVYRRATISDLAKGKSWYREAQAKAAEFAKGNSDIGAGVIAALSPNLSWDLNCQLAERCLRTGQFSGHYGNCTSKARRIAHGQTPLTVLHGHKTISFYKCILTSGECSEVTIDRHAIGIALGHVATDAERRQVRSDRASGQAKYAKYAEAYRNVAVTLGLLPSALQAITWLTWRREKREEI